MALVSLAQMRSDLFGTLHSQLQNDGTPSWLTHYTYHAPTHGLPTLAGAPRPKKPSGSSNDSIGGFLSNALNGIENTVTGIPAGLVASVTHPIATAEAIGHSYATRYSSLLHGHIGAFAQQVYDDPTSYLLDAASVATTVASLGTLAPEVAAADGVIYSSEAARVAALGSDAAEATASGVTKLHPSLLRSPVKGVASRAIGDSRIVQRLARGGGRENPITLTTREGTVVDTGKSFSKNPYIRARQRLTHSLASRLPDRGPGSYFSEATRANRFQVRAEARGAMRLAQMAGAHAAAHAALSAAEDQAMHVRSLGLKPDAWLAHLERIKASGRGLHQADANAYRVLTNHEIRKLVEHPTKKMLKAEKAAKQLGEHQAQLKVDLGILHPATAHAARLRAIQLVRGAKWYTAPKSAKLVEALTKYHLKGQRHIEAQVAEHEAQIAKLETLAKKASTARRPSYAARITERIAAHDHQIVGLHHMQHDLADAIAEHEKNAHGMFVGSAKNRSRLVDIEHDIEHGHPDINNDPFYLPQRAEIPKHGGTVPTAGRGGGMGVTSLAEKANKGTLFEMNKMMLEGDQFTVQHMGFVKGVLYKGLHNVLLGEARQFPVGEQLPPGYRYIRSNASEVIPKLARAEEQGGKLSYHDLTETGQSADHLLLKPGEDPALAEPGAAGTRLAVQDSTIKAVIGEYKAGDGFLKALLNKPTKVWRSLLLGWRPGFFTTNVVGNAFMYALRSDPIKGTTTLLNTIKDLHGPQELRRVLGDERLPKEAQAYFMGKYFPEQVHGGFVGTAASDLSSRAMRGLFIRPTEHIAEHIPRLAATRALLQKTPAYSHFERQLWESTTRPLTFDQFREAHLFHGTSEAAGKSIAADGELKASPLGVHVTPDLEGVAKPYAARTGGQDHGAVAIVHKDDLTAAGGKIGEGTHGGHAEGNVPVRGVAAPAEVENTLRKMYDGYLKGVPARGVKPHWMDVSAAALENDPRLAAEISHKVDDMLGNYTELTNMERNVVRTLFPFYSWYKNIARITFALPESNPMRALLIANLGRVGTDIEAHRYGKNMPSWLKGAIPLGFDLPGFTRDDQHRHSVLTMTGLNPFSTIADEAEVVKSLTGRNQSGNAVTGLMNPFITGGIEAATGNSLLTGQPITDPGLEHVLKAPFANLPQKQLYDSIGAHNKPGQLYGGNWPQYLWSNLGLPEKQVNTQEANKLGKSIAQKNNPNPPKKRRHHAARPGLPTLGG